MKKGIIKLMTAAVAITTMASCSDDLGLSSPKLNGQADLTATLVTNGGAATRLAAIDNGGAAGTRAIVFSSSDVIRVFTMDKLSQDLYEVEQLKNGGLSADFKQIENNGLTGQKYAITEADIIYGISTNGTEPTPLLTLTLPREYKPGFTAEGNQKFPIPFWGKAEEVQGTTASLNAELDGLTAFLRINAATLPAGTKYIVLTTHGSNPYQTATPDGFMLAPFGTTSPDEASASAFWYAKENGEFKNATQITDGYSEALSGTLNAKLVEGAELKIDERLVHSDELIIDLTQAGGNNIAYVPIVCGDYKNLHVIAASYVSKKYKYCYAGTELKNFQDQTFENNTAYYLDMNLADLGAACIGEVNKYIAQNCNTAGITTVINVDSLYFGAYPEHTAHSSYSETRINTNVAGNVILNINAIGVNGEDASPYGKAANNPLLICDRAVEGFASDNVPQTTKEAAGVYRNRFVEINVPSAWYIGQQTPHAAYLKVCEASRDIYLGTVDQAKAEMVNVEIMGSNTKFGNTYTLAKADRGVQEMEILPETQAAVNIRHGFNEVVIDKTVGDVYISTPSQAEEETEISKFNIKTNEATGLRLDNSLIGMLNFSDGTQAKDNRQVFTIGSSAIKQVFNNSNEYADGNMFVAGTTDAAKTPGRVTMRSYWTGSALSARAIIAGYDVPTVFTVAQLASVGEGIYTDGSSNHQTATLGVDPVTPSYNIPKALIRVMWLGGSKYPWIGARARVANFSIDGENTELKNMNMLKDWPGATTYVDDPHWCCTSCWTPDASTSKINLNGDFGLIRSAINDDKVTIKNININDVEIVTAEDDNRRISNVGAVVGRVETQKALIEDNTVGEVKISVKGINVAGVAGIVTIKTQGSDLYITRNQVSGKDGHQAGYIEGASNVGGVVGLAVNGTGKTAISHNIVNLDQSILSTVNGNAGGIVGDLTMKAAADMNDNLVTVNEAIGAATSHAAGLVANVHGNGNLVMKENAIKAKDILATNDFAAGLVGELALTAADVWVQDSIALAPAKRAKTVDVSGAITASNQYAGGLFGKSTLDAGKKSTVISALVDVTTLEATNGFAGGFIGQVLQGATVVGYQNYTSANASCINDVEIDNMKSRYAAGGLIGNNAQANKTPVNIITGKSNVLQANATPYVVSTDIEVKKWEKTGALLTDQDNYKWGTMSNIIGHMQDNLTINNDLSTVEDYAYLNVIDHLNAAAKDAVGYKKHNDEGHNIDDLNNPNAQYYWGDENGYVGVTETGTYKIGTKTVKGEQTTSLDLPANNQFRKLDTYTGTSKLTQGAN